VLNQREYTHITRPVSPPIDLDAGRLDVVRAALAGFFVLAALLLASLGGWLLARMWAYSLLGVVVGFVLAVVGLLFGSVVLWVSVREWLDHRERVADWHAVALDNYADAGGEVVEHVSEWSFTASNPAHVLLMALWVQRAIADGRDTPWSNRSLAGPMFISNRRVGDLTRPAAEEMGRQFARLGLIAGRSERYAGDWVPTSEAEVISSVWDGWR
jgi:hypothetical protein